MLVSAEVSPQFELCYALADASAPTPTVAIDWRAGAADEPAWLEESRSFGWAFWLALPDVLEQAPPAKSVAAFIDAVERLPSETFVRRMRRGLFHTEEGEPLPTRKREWLHYVGIDPETGDDPTSTALRRDPTSLQSATVAVLREFAKAFEPLWESVRPQFEASADRAGRLAQACTFAELAPQLLLRVDVDTAAKRIRALRGGYKIAFDDVARIILMPSAFNSRRFCSAADETLPATLFFPYFDPALSLPAAGPLALSDELDPWLVCRALADPTRAAIVRNLARRPQTASELISTLGLSKATMSHHVFQLREAGLIAEEKRGRSTLLSLKRGTIAMLADALRRELALP